jgi:3-dehydroquinate dehydratase/shikimate dehydrogenase
LIGLAKKKNMTELVGVIEGPTLARAKEQIGKADLADVLEIRLDSLEPKALLRLTELPRTRPWIMTFRRKPEGGANGLPEQERLSLFEKCLSCQPEYCDIESDTEFAFFERIAQAFPRMQIISSFHDFEGMPKSLEGTLQKMHRPHVSHYKMAVTAKTVNDALHLMAFARTKKQLTCIAMGEEGQITRILSPIFGSKFCYAVIEEAESLIGQLSLEVLSHVYRFKEIGPDWQIYALLGDPVCKSIGHLYHNKTFPKGAVYLKLRLAIPDLPLFFSLMRQFPFAGFSVTMPLKELLKPFLTQTDPTASAIGSINTIQIEKGQLIAYNTDGAGALDTLESRLSVKGRHIAVLGAGGSARAIVYEAIRRGAHVTVLNRTLERAQALASDFHCKAAPLEDFSLIRYDVLINTVPVDLIFDPESFDPSAVIMDIVYWEVETPLLKAARERGCTCIDGTEIFYSQARLQQQIWFTRV